MAGTLLVALSVALPSSAEASAAVTPTVPHRPNILFIMIDTLRADRLGCYGYQRNTTPGLDRLAEEGIRFSRMIASSSWTLPSVMSMFTSLPPSLHGAVNRETRLRPGFTTLAEQLNSAGYQTAAFISNPVVHSKFGFGRGFDLYDDFTILLTGAIDPLTDSGAEARIRSVASSPIISRLARNWLVKQRIPEEPFFLFLLYFDPHADYVPPSPYNRMFDPAYTGTVDGKDFTRKKKIYRERDREHISALYDGEIRYTDEHISRFLQKMTDAGLTEDTLIVVTSDHGEEFWEHGSTLHGHSLYEELVRVPFIMFWPGGLPARPVLHQQVSHIDIMPTVLDAVNLPIPEQCLGNSLLPLLKNDSIREFRSETFLETEAGKVDLKAVRTADRKLIWDLKHKNRQIFDLQKDPGELYGRTPDSIAGGQRLAAHLARWYQATQNAEERLPEHESEPLQVDGVLKRALKALGYLH